MARTLGADFQIGAVEKDWPRVSTLIPSPPPPTDAFAGLDAHSPAMKTFTGPASDALFALCSHASLEKSNIHEAFGAKVLTCKDNKTNA
ncbi:hypothetical protein N431DRAFT_470846 [Stipitochalara longipes BDJ]|nr:hypothetical protein N431DRAFT_470846 [Stipitochalara longipes BDJ]